jgi:hypothetical protein
MAKKSKETWKVILKRLGLPETFATEPRVQEKVDLIKRAILEDYAAEHNGALPPASYFAREWADLRAAKDAVESQLSAINHQIEAYTQLAAAQYDAEGVDKIRLDDGEAPRLSYEPYASVEDNDKFLEWCIKNGYRRSLTLPWQTRTAIAKDRIESGEPLPDGIKVWSRIKMVKR